MILTCEPGMSPRFVPLLARLKMPTASFLESRATPPSEPPEMSTDNSRLPLAGSYAKAPSPPRVTEPPKGTNPSVPEKITVLSVPNETVLVNVSTWAPTVERLRVKIPADKESPGNWVLKKVSAVIVMGPENDDAE